MSVATAIAVRPRVAVFPYRLLDGALGTCALVLALQLVPLPPGLRAALSPSAAEVERTLFLAVTDGPRPLSLDPRATAWALAMFLAALLVFWSARTVFHRGEVRSTTRAIAWIALVLAVVAFVQRLTSPNLIYGVWEPLDRASQPSPWGPFVNRNDFATWLMMAAPLTIGYAVARLTARTSSGRAAGVDSALDVRMLALAVSACLTIAVLLASLSRSGLLGLGVALVVLVGFARRRLGVGRRLLWLCGGIAALVLGAIAYVDLAAIAARVENTLPSQLGGRITVWRETWPIARDFPLAGVGAGAFARAMLVYQQSTRLIFFNHAHNEYLQLLVEGGVLLVLPAVAAIAAGTFTVARSVRDDRTSLFWVRAGSAAGLAAVAAQSVWDTGLRLPANALLFAVLAAIAMHRQEQLS
jgi:O-antigen ligase